MNIKDSYKIMTIIYNKRTGKINGVYQGEQHIETLFGEEGEDYKLILDEVIAPMDFNVMQNSRNFKINTELKRLEVLPNTQNYYPIAND